MDLLVKSQKRRQAGYLSESSPPPAVSVSSPPQPVIVFSRPKYGPTSTPLSVQSTGEEEGREQGREEEEEEVLTSSNLPSLVSSRMASLPNPATMEEEGDTIFKEENQNP